MRLPWSALSPAARRGLLAHALHWQAVQIGSLYVGVYLYRMGGGYALPAWHAFCSYLSIPVGYWLAAALTRRRGPGASLRLGLGIYALFQAAILALGPQAGAWAGSLGLLWGMGIGFYWQAWVLLMVDLSAESRDRDAMLASNQSVYFLASFTGAPLAGLFLTRMPGTSGYPWVFGASLLFFVLAWALSLGLRGRPQHSGGALLRLLKARKPAGWNASLVSAALMGFLSVGALFLPMLISFESGGSEGHGGSYAAWTALGGFAASALVARLGHPSRRADFLLWSALVIAGLTLPLAFDRSYSLVLLYGLGMAVAMSVFNVPLFAAQIRIIESNPRFLHRRADAMLLREIPLNLGRALACGVVLWGVTDLRSGALTLLLAGLAFAPLVNYATVRPWLRSAALPD
jgi:MFS transporter, YQGE family, putative transporter